MRDFADFGSWPGLLRALRAMQDRLDETLRRRHDLCLTWFEVMAELEASDGPVRVSALADRVTISQPRVSRVLAAMEERGLVDRGSVADDGRGTEVELTALGREELAAAALTYRQTLEDSLLGRLTDKEAQMLQVIGQKLGREARPQPGAAAARRAVPAVGGECGPGC